MNRHAVQTAFGRVGAAARTTTTTTPTTQCLLRTTPRTFSTTAAAQSDGNSSSPKKPLDASGRERSAEAATKLGALIRTRTQERMRGDGPAPAAPVDARFLGARVVGGDGGPKVINLRSLRAAPGGFIGRGDGLPPARGGFVRRGGGGAAGGSGASTPRFGGARFGAAGGANTGRTGGFGGGANRSGGSRGRGGSARGGSRGGGGKDRAGGKKKDSRLDDKPVDREWSNAEMKVLDRLDQGELTPYTPQATLEALVGYGPAIATDNALGKMESALRSMRMMGGGQAFDNDPAGTVDTKAFAKRYLHDKKPIFFNTKQEKEWLERSMKGMKIAGPVDPIKQGVLETAVMGKYQATEFKEIKDVAGTMANYHSRHASYRASHSLEFAEKVLSILPGQAKGGNGKAAAARA